MRYEVEQKYLVASHDEILKKLQAMGLVAEATVVQVDTYYAHPQRDFAATDEALRIRRVGDENHITYKGPKFDANSKTRQEIELAIASGDEGAQRCDEIWQALGFQQVSTVAKTRQIYRLRKDGYNVELAVDQVEGLGSYVELETVVDGDAKLAASQAVIANLATELGLSKTERRSYLELLLEPTG